MANPSTYPSRIWRSGSRNCFTCGDPGHLAKNCPKAVGKKINEDVSCYLCGEKGHKKRDCPLQERKDRRARQNDRMHDGENGTVNQTVSRQHREGERIETRNQQEDKQQETENGQGGGAGRYKERGGVSTHQEDRQQRGGRGREATQTRPTGKDISCFLCGEKGHKKRDCPYQDFGTTKQQAKGRGIDQNGYKQQGETKKMYPTDKQMHPATTVRDTTEAAESKARQVDEKDDTQQLGIEGTQAVLTHPTGSRDVLDDKRPQKQHPGKSTDTSAPSLGDSVQDKNTQRYQSGQGSTPDKNDRQMVQNRDRRYTRNSGRNGNLFSEFAALPNYVDTHCHLEYVLERSYLNRYGDLKKKFGYPDNFRGCITSFCDPPAFSSFGLWQELLEEDGVWGTFGIHPRHARAYTDKIEETMIACLSHSKCVGFGEMGLDYSDHCINESPADVQNQVLKRLLRLAPVMCKPLVLHCRDAEEDLLQCLTSAGVPSDWKIHLHCYSGSLRMARRFLDVFPNLYFGFTGQITYRRSEENRDVAAELPADRILLETDSPYLTPVSFKERDVRICHPPMAGAVAHELARARDEPVAHMMTILQENCAALYGV